MFPIGFVKIISERYLSRCFIPTEKHSFNSWKHNFLKLFQPFKQTRRLQNVEARRRESFFFVRFIPSVVAIKIHQFPSKTLNLCINREQIYHHLLSITLDWILISSVCWSVEERRFSNWRSIKLVSERLVVNFNVAWTFYWRFFEKGNQRIVHINEKQCWWWNFSLNRLRFVRDVLKCGWQFSALSSLFTWVPLRFWVALFQRALMAIGMENWLWL